MKQLVTVILAAGKGTRMKTPDNPKVLHCILGKPMIQYVIDVARKINSTRIILVIGYGAEAIKAALSDQSDLEYVIQKEQLGTGHALLQTMPILNDHKGPVLVLSGDVPLISCFTLNAMINHFNTNKLTGCVASFNIDNPHGYGRIHRNCLGRFIEIVEEKDINIMNENLRKVNEVNAGIYIFKNPPLFDALAKITNNNSQGEYYLPDLFKIWQNDLSVKLSTFHNKNLAIEARGVNTIEELLKLEELLK